MATKKTTGDLATRRGAGDPVRRAEWMTVLRHGHLWSAPVVVEVYARSGNRPHSVQPLLDSARPTWRLLDGFLPLQRRANASALPLTKCRCEREGPEVSERCRVMRSQRRNVQKIVRDFREILIADSRRVNSAGRTQPADFPGVLHGVRPCGLWASLRDPIFTGYQSMSRSQQTNFPIPDETSAPVTV